MPLGVTVHALLAGSRPATVSARDAAVSRGLDVSAVDVVFWSVVQPAATIAAMVNIERVRTVGSERE